MMRWRPSLNVIGISIAVLLAAQSASAAPGETPELFLRRLYAHYRNGGPGISRERHDGSAFYAPILLDWFERDAAGGDGVTIDWDPLCGCQDFENLQVRRLTITDRQAGMVKAQVSLRNLGKSGTVVLTLTPTQAGWRVADVVDDDEKSIMTLLRNANTHPVSKDPKAKPPQP